MYRLYQKRAISTDKSVQNSENKQRKDKNAFLCYYIYGL